MIEHHCPTIALSYFFSKNDIQDPARGYFTDSSKTAPIQTIPALRSALFVHHLQDFNFVLSRNTKRMCEQVADLCVLATRLHSMKIFKLSFLFVGNYFPLTEKQTFTQAAGGMWFEHVTSFF